MPVAIAITGGVNDDNLIHFELALSNPGSGDFTFTLPAQYRELSLSPVYAVSAKATDANAKKGSRVWNVSNLTISSYDEAKGELKVGGSGISDKAVIRAAFLVTA